jgi:hypothetical protein
MNKLEVVDLLMEYGTILSSEFRISGRSTTLMSILSYLTPLMGKSYGFDHLMDRAQHKQKSGKHVHRTSVVSVAPHNKII